MTLRMIVTGRASARRRLANSDSHTFGPVTAAREPFIASPREEPSEAAVSACRQSATRHRLRHSGGADEHGVGAP